MTSRYEEQNLPGDGAAGDAIYRQLLSEFAARGQVGLEFGSTTDSQDGAAAPEDGSSTQDGDDERDALIQLGLNVARVVVSGVGIAVGFPVAF